MTKAFSCTICEISVRVPSQGLGGLRMRGWRMVDPYAVGGWVRMHLEGAMSVTALAREVGAPERSIRMGFDRAGLPPPKYWGRIEEALGLGADAIVNELNLRCPDCIGKTRLTHRAIERAERINARREEQREQLRQQIYSQHDPEADRWWKE